MAALEIAANRLVRRKWAHCCRPYKQAVERQLTTICERIRMAAMPAFMTINFEKSEDGWLAQSGKYEMRREGLRVGQRFTLFMNGQREVSFFAIPSQARGPGGNEYTWTLGALAEDRANQRWLRDIRDVIRRIFQSIPRLNEAAGG